jgi:hypothetical protein
MMRRSMRFGEAARAGSLILALYAMLLQGFFGAVLGPAHAAHPGAPIEGYVICLAGQEAGQEAGQVGAPAAPAAPVAPHAHDCVCPALCSPAAAHPGLGGKLASPGIVRLAVAPGEGDAAPRAGPPAYVRPPARAPPLATA